MVEDLIFFYPEGHNAHVQQGHPERPERVETIRQSMEQARWWERFPKIEPLTIPEEVLYRIHEPDYLNRLQEISRRGVWFDMDTYATPESWGLAYKAAGGAIAIASAIWKGQAHKGFALTRPPGHHATATRAMGFCLMNNISLAAEYLLRIEGATRLAIIDLDLHHGNGTEEIFYDREDVFYISTHQSPLFPGTGEVGDTGAGKGVGVNANFPLPPYSGDKAFLTVLDELIVPLLFRFSPEMLLVSYGFDTHWRDPLGNLLLSANVYGDLVSLLNAWAERYCNGRIALFLEGGYDLDAARVCSQAVVSAMLKEPWEDTIGPSPKTEGNAWEGMVRQALDIWRL